MGKRSFESFDWECEEKQVGMGGCIEWMLRTYLDIRSQVGHFMIYECHNIGEADSCGTMLTWIARNFLALISGRMLLCWVRFWCLDSLVLPCIFDISIFHTWPLNLEHNSWLFIRWKFHLINNQELLDYYILVVYYFFIFLF